MTVSCLRNALFTLALALGASTGMRADPPAARAVLRPQITSLTLDLEDGRSYALTAEQLADPGGGAIFWGDWAVTNILVLSHSLNPKAPVSPFEVLALWYFPGPSGQRPAFLVNTGAGPVYPLDPADPRASPSFSFAHRPLVTAITVGYADGRRLPLSQLALRDSRSGVLVWNDHAVSDLFIPFYLTNPSLPTRPADVMRTWNKPIASTGTSTTSRTLATDTMELPAFMIKPMCIPGYPGIVD